MRVETVEAPATSAVEGTHHVGVVHVREAVLALAGSARPSVRELMQTPLRLESDL